MTLLQLSFQKECHVSAVRMASAPAMHYCVAGRDRERKSLSEQYIWGHPALPASYYSPDRMKNSTLEHQRVPCFKKMVLVKLKLIQPRYAVLY